MCIRDSDYRDTFFVHFDIADRPSGDELKKAVESLGDKYELSNLKVNEGQFESITIKSPHDSAAMDISFVQGEEVVEQVKELMTEFRTITLQGDDHKKLSKLGKCNARFDIFLFGQTSGGEEEMLDPGGLFLVMEKIAGTCEGVGLDPQSNALI